MRRPEPGVAVAETVTVAGAATTEFVGDVIETDIAQLGLARSNAHIIIPNRTTEAVSPILTRVSGFLPMLAVIVASLDDSQRDVAEI
jgi:hypothetical protein